VVVPYATASVIAASHEGAAAHHAWTGAPFDRVNAGQQAAAEETTTRSRRHGTQSKGVVFEGKSITVTGEYPPVSHGCPGAIFGASATTGLSSPATAAARGLANEPPDFARPDRRFHWRRLRRRHHGRTAKAAPASCT
jgi:hypothetical protein